MDNFAHVQTEMQNSINSQTSMMHGLFGHFRINPNAYILQRFKLGGGVGCPGMSHQLSHSFPAFPVMSSLALPVDRITTVVMTASKYCFH
jgi:hypothetical protein